MGQTASLKRLESVVVGINGRTGEGDPATRCYEGDEGVESSRVETSRAAPVGNKEAGRGRESRTGASSPRARVPQQSSNKELSKLFFLHATKHAALALVQPF